MGSGVRRVRRGMETWVLDRCDRLHLRLPIPPRLLESHPSLPPTLFHKIPILNTPPPFRTSYLQLPPPPPLSYQSPNKNHTFLPPLPAFFPILSPHFREKAKKQKDRRSSVNSVRPEVKKEGLRGKGGEFPVSCFWCGWGFFEE